MCRHASIPRLSLNLRVFRPPATPPSKNDLISAMKSHRLICSEIRRIEVEEFELGPLPDDGILVENEFTAEVSLNLIDPCSLKLFSTVLSGIGEPEIR